MARGMAILCAIGLSACATTTPVETAPRQASIERPLRAAAAQPDNFVMSRYDAEIAGETMFSQLTGLPASPVRLAESTISRISIGQTGLPEAEAHERFVGAFDDPAKILRSGTAAETPVLPAQNSFADNGWRQAESGYVHLPSGFVCPNAMGLTLKDEATGESLTLEIPLNQIRNFATDGSDTACDFVNQSAGIFLTFFVSNFPQLSLDDHYSAALKHIVDRFPITSETTVFAPAIELDTRDYESRIEGVTKAGAFLLEPQNGITGKTALWLNKTGDWHIKARGTYVVAVNGDAPGSLTAAELLAAIYHTATLFNVDKYTNSEERGAGGVQVSF